MAIRKPLVIVNGTMQELPVGDKTPSSTLSVFTNAQTVIGVDISSGYLPVLNHATTTIKVPLS
jgi:hypothetical protein